MMIDPWLHGTFTKKYLDPLPGYFKEGTSSPEAPVTTIDNDGLHTFIEKVLVQSLTIIQVATKSHASHVPPKKTSRKILK